jgi:exodeoxyribonuclease V alpha subunit
METLKVYVKRISYRSEDTGFSVLIVEFDNVEKYAVGTFPQIDEGMHLEVKGEWVEHPMYGKQFSVKEHTQLPFEDSMSIERYLGSGAIKGVGPALARRICAKFEEDTLRIIEEEPERLSEVRGISKQSARRISTQLEEKKETRSALMFLQKYGISNTVAIKIYRFYGDRIYTIMEPNPYQLADDIYGIVFRKADEIASKSGVLIDTEFRVRSGISYALLRGSASGHVYMPEDLLIKSTMHLLQVTEEEVAPHIMNLYMDKKIVIKEWNGERCIYAPNLYYAELNSARMILDLNETESLVQTQVDEREEKIERIISKDEEQGNYILDDIQRKAIRDSIYHGVLLITGGPGTGKTTIINSIIKYYLGEGKDVFLAAPTGRAAKRMEQATGYEARTIHRMLEVSGGELESGRKSYFGRDEENPLEADVVIVDEVSMMDVFLFNALLKAIPPGSKLILVGDIDQLPSVGPGQVLRDLIESGYLPVSSLRKIYRQGEKSLIVRNAHRINEGEPIVTEKDAQDFFLMSRNQSIAIQKDMVGLIRRNLPEYYHVESFDVQVLTPMREGELGVNRLNVILQDALNPKEKHKHEVVIDDRIIREGDKVMQIKNNYQIEWEIQGNYKIPIDKGTGVFNGDMGRVVEINEYAQQVTVEYEEHKRVTYPYFQLDQLELAYAITIHKSQGSEYPVVIMPILGGPRNLFCRNLLYTGVTRAKECLLLMGSREVVNQMIDNSKVKERYTSLSLQIADLMKIANENAWS